MFNEINISFLKQIPNISVFHFHFFFGKKKMSLPSFSKDTPNKIGKGINVSGKNTLIKTEENGHRAAIADEPIDATVDGKKMFCVRVDNAGSDSSIMFGFTAMETFDSNKNASFSDDGFTGCGIHLYFGTLCYPVNKWNNIIDSGISEKAKEIIVILTISDNGKKKEIRFLCDGKESKTTDVSEILKGDVVFPAICLCDQKQQVTTIPIDQIKTRTPEIENLIKECQQQQNRNNNQSGGAVASSSSSATIQLQKERDEERRKNAALSAQLKKKEDEIAALYQQRVALFAALPLLMVAVWWLKTEIN
jgi:hypothetical protein